jgi:hypothetical protein
VVVEGREEKRAPQTSSSLGLSLAPKPMSIKDESGVVFKEELRA